MEILRLHPLTQAELAGNSPNFLPALLQGRLKTGIQGQRLGRDLAERVAAGGYPPALKRSSPKRRAVWYRDYAETLVQRDIRDLARINRMDALPRLLTLAAGQTARLLNVSDLAAPFQVTRPTIREYMTLLSRIFLLEELPLAQQPDQSAHQDPETASRRHGPGLRPARPGCRRPLGRSRRVWPDAGNIHLSGTEAPGRLAR